jgi:pimeloyl-ACP methyl ester carboxylesterase
LPLPPWLPDASVSVVNHVYYLHGFASSAGLTKARFFADRLWEHGVELHCPDFNVPDFSTLTMTRMLEQLAGEISTAAEGRLTLVGSSLGGALAILAAERWLQVTRLVLLAPAVMFAKPGHHLLPTEQLERWRRTGTKDFVHCGYGGERPLRYEFYEDSLRYDAMNAEVHQPTLIFQGRGDMSVDFRTVARFASTRPNVSLTLLDDDHSLVASLPRIWQELPAFLGLP